MARITNELLREAIADAEQVRETAIANAKLQLEESLTPSIKRDILSALKGDKSGLVTEASNPMIGTDPQDFADVTEGKESVDLKTSGVGSSGNSGRTKADNQMGPEPGSTGGTGPAPSLTSSGIGQDGESSGKEDRGAAKKKGSENAETVLTDLKEEEELDEDEDDLNEDMDLEAIIRELQADVDALADMVPGMEGGDEGGDEFGDDDEEMDMDAGTDDGGMDYDDDEEGEFGGEEEDDDEIEEDFDLDAILREIEAELSENDNDTMAEQFEELKMELAEHRTAVQLLRSKLNEVNLLNAKLLYTNKLFSKANLTNEQKIHVVETFDMATTLREIKLLYATLTESVYVRAEKKPLSNSKRVVTEGIASKAVGSTAPKGDILTENADSALRTRLQELAGIKIL